MCLQNLRYGYLYAESTEYFKVESTYILEHYLRPVSGNQEHTDTKLCAYPRALFEACVSLESAHKHWNMWNFFIGIHSKSQRRVREKMNACLT